MIIDDTSIEVAEWIDPAGLARLHGCLIPVLLEILEFRFKFGTYGVAVVDGIDREIFTVLWEGIWFCSHRTTKHTMRCDRRGSESGVKFSSSIQTFDRAAVSIELR